MGRDGDAARAELTVRARGLAARYGERVALTGFDLDVAPGEIVGLLGPNGAGKSTALRLVSTACKPSAGTLALFGSTPFRSPDSAIPRSPLTSIRRRIGIAGDEPVHVEALTGRENAVCLARSAGLARGEAARLVGELLERFGLAADADRPVAEYSLGMRRRLLLIEALAHQPDLIVLDEPTTGLDPVGRELLRDVLIERRGFGAAILLASNDVAVVEQVASRVVFLRAGGIVLEGEPARLVARLGLATRFEFRLAAAQVPLVACDGVEIAVVTRDRLVAHSSDGAAALPALCEAILRAGAQVEAVDIARPGLADVFLRATGEELPVPASQLRSVAG